MNIIIYVSYVIYLVRTSYSMWFPCLTIDIGDKYSIALRNEFDTLQGIPETLTLNDEYENLVNDHMNASAECIPIKLRTKHRVPWEILAVRKKRDNVKACNKRNPTYGNVQELKKAQRNLIKA